MTIQRNDKRRKYLYQPRPYNCGPTAKRFHETFALVRGMRGPRNSGKSVAMCWDMNFRMRAIAPMVGTNIRSSKWLIVAKTYNRIQDTALAEWTHWFGEPITSVWLGNRPRAVISYDVGDGTRVEAEMLFAAADDQEAAAQFKSMQMTGGWLVEASEIEEENVLSMMIDTVGRYPSKIDGGCGELGGIIMDTNAMSDTHWWYKKEVVEQPDGWKFFVQPPAMLEVVGSNPPRFVPNMGQDERFAPAENVENLNGGWKWYLDRLTGKSTMHVRVYFCNEFGSLESGIPVYHEFNDTEHAVDNLPVYKGLPLVICADFGRTPAFVFVQLDTRGQLRAVDEITSKNFSMREVCRQVVVPKLRNEYAGMTFMAFGENSGDTPGSQNDASCFDEFYDITGIRMDRVSTNLWQPRREAVSYFLQTRDGFKISRKKCPMLYSGFLGQYCLDTTGLEEKGVFGHVKKNMVSHIHDALQAGALWARGRSIGRTFQNGRWVQNIEHTRGTVRPVNNKTTSVAWQ